MCRKPTVAELLSPDSAQCSVCLYASLFLHASITLMATVCPFFPSQLVGVPAAESGDYKQVKSPPLHPQTANRAIDSIFDEEGELAPHLFKCRSSLLQMGRKPPDSGILRYRSYRTLNFAGLS